MSRMIFIVAETPWRALDESIVTSDGAHVAKWHHGKTLEELRATVPTVQLVTEEAYWAAHDEHYRSQPVEIDTEAYQYGLDVLPPIGWVRRERGESFKMREFVSGDITDIYARRGNRYWKFRDRASMPHHDIMQLIDRHTESLHAKVPATRRGSTGSTFPTSCEGTTDMDTETQKVDVLSVGHSEGWGVFDIDGTGVLTVQRLDEADEFASDADARTFVEARAAEGSQLHIDALARVSPEVRHG